MLPEGIAGRHCQNRLAVTDREKKLLQFAQVLLQVQIFLDTFYEKQDVFRACKILKYFKIVLKK